jgi:hypothetical protein
MFLTPEEIFYSIAVINCGECDADVVCLLLEKHRQKAPVKPHFVREEVVR